MAMLIKGSEMRKVILEEIKTATGKLKSVRGITPGLVTILVGNNPASVSYVTLKVKTANELGFYEVQRNLPESTTEVELLSVIAEYNADPKIHGILVQLPLPKHINEDKIINAINPDKDVDGFHPVNLGRLLLGGNNVKFVPCTPAAIIEMLVRSKIRLDGVEAVVVGRSDIVGKPVALMLAQRGVDATVTITHTHTKNLAEHCKRADVLIVAAGVPGLVQAEWIKPGATVIDVGVNRIGINPETGKALLRGDVDFEQAKDRAGAITPVPGGVGPMTITMLMKNTLTAAMASSGMVAHQ